MQKSTKSNQPTLDYAQLQLAKTPAVTKIPTLTKLLGLCIKKYNKISQHNNTADYYAHIIEY